MAQSDIDATMRSIERAAERVIKRIAFSIQGQLKVSTPVDTSWARSNWLVSIGRPVTQPAGSPTAVGQASAAQSAGEARLLVYNFSQGDIWLSNNVPYIQKLNTGHSKQAPANFIERAIQQGIAAIARGST
jgi:hypothetical protein